MDPKTFHNFADSVSAYLQTVEISRETSRSDMTLVLHELVEVAESIRHLEAHEIQDELKFEYRDFFCNTADRLDTAHRSLAQICETLYGKTDVSLDELISSVKDAGEDNS
jgi:hypothetical protein